QFRRRQRLRQLDVGLHLQRLLELLEADLALLEADDGDDAEMDVRARADRVLVEARAGAQLQRLLQQGTRGLVVLLVVGVDRFLVQVRDLVDRGLILRGGRALSCDDDEKGKKGSKQKRTEARSCHGRPLKDGRAKKANPFLRSSRVIPAWGAGLRKDP